MLKFIQPNTKLSYKFLVVFMYFFWFSQHFSYFLKKKTTIRYGIVIDYVHRWAPIPLSLIFKAISVKKSKAISDIAISCFYDCIYIVMPCDMNKLKQYRIQTLLFKAL